VSYGLGSSRTRRWTEVCISESMQASNMVRRLLLVVATRAMMVSEQLHRILAPQGPSPYRRVQGGGWRSLPTPSRDSYFTDEY
jgi:hypothetical protein